MNGAKTLISQDSAAENVGKKKGLGWLVGDRVPDFSGRINITYKLKRVTQKGEKREKVMENEKSSKSLLNFQCETESGKKMCLGSKSAFLKEVVKMTHLTRRRLNRDSEFCL